MAEIHEWDRTADNNTDAPPDGAPEGIAPADLNNILREMMAAMARYFETSNALLTTSGTNTAYVLTPTQT